MPALVPIDSFQQAAALRREHFIGQHPYPFLVQATGPTKRLDPEKRDDLTSDRLVLERPRKALLESMLVAPLTARDPDADRVSIGVAAACDIVLDDASVSKRHAWFEQAPNEEGWTLHDADSSAGTLVNNEPVAPGAPRTLVSGDLITLGYVEVMFMTADGFYDLIHGLFPSDASPTGA